MSHPDADTLRDFVAGALDADADAQVREHLQGGCGECHAIVHGEAAVEHALWEVAEADRAAADEIAPVVPLAPRRSLPRWSTWVGGGALAASALLAVFVLSSGDEAPAPAPEQQPPVAGQAAPPGQVAMAGQPAAVAAAPGAVPGQPAATPPATPEPAAAAAATPEPAAEPAAAKAAKTAKPRKPSGRRAPAAKPKPKAEPPPPPSPKPKRRRDCDPILDMDCDSGATRGGGGGGKKTLSPSDILSVVRKNLGGINRCSTKHGVRGTVKAEWRVLKSGRTSSVRILTKEHAGAPVGQCIVGEIKKWKFPRYTGSPPPPVKFPFKLKG
jgi:hypothetical protein